MESQLSKIRQMLIDYIQKIDCPILRSNMNPLLLGPFEKGDYHQLQRNLMDPSIIMFQNRSTDPMYKWAVSVVEEIIKLLELMG